MAFRFFFFFFIIVDVLFYYRCYIVILENTKTFLFYKFLEPALCVEFVENNGVWLYNSIYLSVTGIPLPKIIGTILCSYPPLLTALVEISFSSVGRAVAYNVKGPGIESHCRGHCIFRR